MILQKILQKILKNLFCQKNIEKFKKMILQKKFFSKSQDV